MKSILVVGATGQLGRHIVTVLKERNYKVRILSRNPEKLGQLRHLADEIFSGDLTYPVTFACDGVDAVISAAGASMDLNNFSDKISFNDVDYRGNANLLTEAQRFGVQKFVYVSVFGGASLNTAYTNAHEHFVNVLRKSGIPSTVMRPTGFFSINAEFVKQARLNRGMVIGSGTWRTNPIHERDLAEACVDALDSTQEEVNLGGPDVFSRQEIVEMAFKALGKKPSIMHVPVWSAQAIPFIAKPFNRRIAELIEFGVRVATQDCIAPKVGGRRLEDFFAELAANG